MGTLQYQITAHSGSESLSPESLGSACAGRPAEADGAGIAGDPSAAKPGSSFALGPVAVGSLSVGGVASTPERGERASGAGAVDAVVGGVGSASVPKVEAGGSESSTASASRVGALEK